MLLLKERLIALGVPRSVSSDTVTELQKWLERSGPEWTVKRLKQLKQELISRVSENDYRAPWVARNKDSLPRGPFSWFFRQALSMRDDKISLAINSLMIYSSFVSDDVTNDQRSKFFSSMESEDETGTSARPKLYPRIASDSPARSRIYTVKYFLANTMSPAKFQPGIDGKSYPEDDFVEQFKFALGSLPCRELIINYSQVARDVLPMALYMNATPAVIKDPAQSLNADSVVRHCIGKISFIQEAGFKLRAVANPSRIIQCMMNPLKGFLKELLLDTTTDCTFDQEKGITRIQGWLREGKVCHSIDLSDATNTFPRRYQISLAYDMVMQLADDPYRDSLITSLEVFEHCCNAWWFSKDKGVVSKHRFTRGQPLGLGPSFFLFGFTHNVLLDGLCVKHSLPRDSFVVLGDDVCISDQKLATLYRLSLNNLGCKISEAKSIVSDKFAEFAGVIISPKRRINQFKWRDMDNNNFIDVCRQIGPKSIELLTSRQKRVIEAIAEIPSELGGMGWNPSGKSLDKRLSSPLALQLLEQNRSFVLFESVRSLDQKFWNSPKLRSLTMYQEILDPGVNPNPRFHKDGQSLGSKVEIDNYEWLRLTKHFDHESNLMRPMPPFLLVDRDSLLRPSGYIISMPTPDHYSRTRDICTITIIEKKIRAAMVSTA